MWKRIIASMIIAFNIMSISTFAYAAPEASKSVNIDQSKYEILNPKKSSFSTTDKVILISGKAPTGTQVNIDMYGTTDLTKTNFNLEVLPEEEDYIELASEVVTSGNMGFFQKQMDLVLGINKIVVDFNVEGLSPNEIIIYVYDKSKAEINLVKPKETKLIEFIPLLK